MNKAFNKMNKAFKYTVIILSGFLWIYSLVLLQNIYLSVLLGLQFVCVCFYESLLYKPINLMGWNTTKLKK